MIQILVNHNSSSDSIVWQFFENRKNIKISWDLGSQQCHSLKEIFDSHRYLRQVRNNSSIHIKMIVNTHSP